MAQPIKALETKPDAEFHPQNPYDTKRENQLSHVVLHPSLVHEFLTQQDQMQLKNHKGQGHKEHSALSPLWKAPIATPKLATGTLLEMRTLEAQKRVLKGPNPLCLLPLPQKPLGSTRVFPS